MQGFIESGAIVDFMLVFVALELGALLLYRQLRGGGIAAPQLIANIGAGTSLMLALRCALLGAAWYWLASALIGALVFHSVDLLLRWPARER